MHPNPKALRFLSAVSALASAACFAAPPSALSGSVSKTLAGSSSAFIENKGQWDSRALFLSRTKGLNLWITQEGPVFDFRAGAALPSAEDRESNRRVREALDKHPAQGDPESGQVVKMTFLNARPSAVEGENQQKTKFNYFIGNDKSQWASDVPSFSQAVAQNPYDGVSIRYSIDQGTPRYDLIVKPGADPSQVGIKIEGADDARVLPNGNLELRTSLGTVEERGLTAFQETPNGRTEVPCRMVMDGNVMHFDTGAYDANRPLVIDPLIFATYLGGSATELCRGVALDSSGNVVVAGQTSSANFPTTTGAYQQGYPSGNSNSTGFVAKLSSDGAALLFSTYLGGNDVDACLSLALDSSNDLFVTGQTESTNFPTTAGAFQTTNHSSGGAAFMVELSADGTTLLAGTYLSGSLEELGRAIALDSSGNPVLAGTTYSPDFPTTAGVLIPSPPNGSNSGFVAKLSSDGTTLMFGTYLGGNGGDASNDLCVDSQNNVTVVGVTSSSNFPVSAGAYEPNLPSSAVGAAYVVKLSPDATALVSGSYLGGNAESLAEAVSLDPSGNVAVSGYTTSNNFPTTAGAFQTVKDNAGSAGFVSLLSSDGTTLLSSTYLGGSGYAGLNMNETGDECNALATDSAGNFVVAGYTDSTNFPTSTGALQSTNANLFGTGFLAKISADGTTLLYGTYLGGNGSLAIPEAPGDSCNALALDSFGNAVIAGQTNSTNLPTSQGAFQSSNNADNETGFVAKLGLPPYVTGVSVAPSSLTGGQSATGTVQISAPAGSGGDTIYLSTGGSAAATVSPTVTIPKGSTTASFSITTSPVSANAVVTVTGSFLGSSESAALTVSRPTLSLLVLSNDSVVGGQSVTGTVYLASPAGPTGAVVTLGGFYQAYTLPSVTISAGATSAQFTVTTGPVAFTDYGSIYADYNDGQVTANFTVNPPTVLSVSATPSSVVGGANSLGTVTLTGPAGGGEAPKRTPGGGRGGVFVQLSSNTSEVTVPSEVEVLTGNTMAGFNIQTVPVSTTSVATITASYNDTSQTTTITLSPSTISKFSFYPAVIIGGQSTTGTVTIAGPAGSTGNTIKLSSSTAEATVPATVKIASGQTSVQFTVSTIAVSSDSVATIKATFGAIYQTATVTLLPSPVSTITFNPNSIVGGQNGSCTITLTGKAGPYGNVIKLAASTAELTVPPTVTVPAGTSSYTFNVPTVPVSSNSQTTVTSTFALDSHSTTLTLRPATLITLTLPTSPVVGGQTATGSVQLSSVAGQYGNVVKIKSSNGDATVPATVTVLGGQDSAQFTIHTVAVSSNRTVTISVTFGTTTLSKSLTITP